MDYSSVFIVVDYLVKSTVSGSSSVDVYGTVTRLLKERMFSIDSEVTVKSIRYDIFQYTRIIQFLNKLLLLKVVGKQNHSLLLLMLILLKI